jgi:hypothetical protein
VRVVSGSVAGGSEGYPVLWGRVDMQAGLTSGSGGCVRPKPLLFAGQGPRGLACWTAMSPHTALTVKQAGPSVVP